eukprot:2342080-Amphidinium_carterae.1
MSKSCHLRGITVIIRSKEVAKNNSKFQKHTWRTNWGYFFISEVDLFLAKGFSGDDVGLVVSNAAANLLVRFSFQVRLFQL